MAGRRIRGDHRRDAPPGGPATETTSRRPDEEAIEALPVAVTLSAEQYDVVARALADAETLQRCFGDPGQADEYRKVAEEIEQEADR